MIKWTVEVMDLSIIFATYKNEHILEKSLQAYCQISTPYQWELIIVDNACRKETTEVVAKFLDRLPITFIDRSKPGKIMRLIKH